MSGAQIEQVAALRAQLWAGGFRPVMLPNRSKIPIGKDWPDRARQNPPECTVFTPVPHALNTGILCDGLRAIDLDIDDKELEGACRSIILDRFGEAPIRTRCNSPRCTILYRAAVGEPPYTSITGESHKKDGRNCQIEVHGKGKQILAFGTHPSGAELEWFPDPPGQETLESLPAITEDELFDALAECAAVIDAELPNRTNGEDHAPGDPQADTLRLAAALHDIPNGGPADWEAWNRIGMAVWRATGGGNAGWEAWNAWSQRNAAYDAAQTRERWDHYFVSPPTQIGAGTIFHLAAEASRREKPQEQEQGDTRGDHPPRDDRRNDTNTPQAPAFLDPWADPPPPAFPGRILRRDIEDAVFATALRNGFCPGVLAMAELAAISGAASKAIRFTPYQNSTWWVPPIIWVMPILDVGQRKTAIQEIAFAPVRAAHSELWRHHRGRMRAWHALSPKEKHSTPKPIEPHSFTVDDVTVEKLQRDSRRERSRHGHGARRNSRATGVRSVRWNGRCCAQLPLRNLRSYGENRFQGRPRQPAY